MGRTVVMKLLLALFAPLTLAFAPGPAPVPNHHPLYVGLLVPPPASAEPVDRFTARLSVDHTNIFLLMADADWSVHQDMELTQTTLTLRAPVADGWEAGVSAPVYYQSAGFADGPVGQWHDWLGVPSYTGQEEYGENNYANILYHGGRKMIEPKPEEALAGDVTVWVKGMLWRGPESSLAAEIFWQAPTGDANAGVSNGEHEGAARLLIGVEGPDGLKLTVGGGVALPGSLKGFHDTVDLSPFGLWFFAAEAPFVTWPRLSLLLQSQGNGSPLPDAEGYQYSRIFTEATFGVRYRAGSDASPHWLTLALSENLNQTNPDFTLHLSVDW